MATVTDICNAALSHCGTRSKISSLDEGSPEANACLTHFAMLRDYMLRAFDWNFARFTVALAELPDPPARWARKYALPADCLRIRRLNDVPVLVLPETFCELAAEKDSTGAASVVVLTDAAPVSAIYTAQVSDTLRWDQGFVTAVTYGLAARVCYELTGKDDRVRTLTQLWQATLQQAAAEAASEGSSFARLYLPEALMARGYTGAGD
jgi:hypothetical protein